MISKGMNVGTTTFFDRIIAALKASRKDLRTVYSEHFTKKSS